jgi:hypothetical protein
VAYEIEAAAAKAAVMQFAQPALGDAAIDIGCTLALTITARPTPSFLCRMRKSSSGASGGVYGRPSA